MTIWYDDAPGYAFSSDGNAQSELGSLGKVRPARNDV